MTASTTIYSCAAQFFGDGTVDFNSDQIMAALVSSNYTFNQTSHTQFSDASPFEIAAVNGYSAGGTTCVGTVTRTGATTVFGLTDAVWIASGGNISNFRGVVFYMNGTRNSVTNPLIAYGLADITPADIPATLNGATLRVRINTNGLFNSP